MVHAGRLRREGPNVPPAGYVRPVSAVERLLESARARLDRVEPDDLDAEVAAGALVVDTRCEALRRRDGELPGAVVVERTQLEWRLDPTSPWRIPEADDPARRVIVVCDEGFASSLAAAVLRDLGLTRATDVVGGFQAWRARSAPPTDRR